MHVSQPLGESHAADNGHAGSVESASCVCGHSLAVHQHYRRGRDCGVCGATQCGKFRDRRTQFQRLRDLVRPA